MSAHDCSRAIRLLPARRKSNRRPLHFSQKHGDDFVERWGGSFGQKLGTPFVPLTVNAWTLPFASLFLNCTLWPFRHRLPSLRAMDTSAGEPTLRLVPP